MLFFKNLANVGIMNCPVASCGVSEQPKIDDLSEVWSEPLKLDQQEDQN